MSPELIAESAKNFVDVYGAEDARRFIEALQMILAPAPEPEPHPDPAFAASLKTPRRRQRPDARIW